MNERHPRSPFQAIRPIDYTIIFVRDMAAMRRFYEDILCFPPSRELSPGALTLDKSVTRYNEFDISNKVREKGWILLPTPCRQTRKRSIAFELLCVRTSIEM